MRRSHCLQRPAQVRCKEWRLDCPIGSRRRIKCRLSPSISEPNNNILTLQLGHIAIQIAARGMGMRVIGIDYPGKKDLIKECGAEVYINHGDGNAEEVKKATGGLGAQAVLVLIAANGAYASAMGLLHYGGTLVAVALAEGELKPIATAFPSTMVAKAQSIVGVAVGDRKDTVETLEFAERDILKTHFRLAKMDELTSLFEEMKSQTLKGRVVLDLS